MNPLNKIKQFVKEASYNEDLSLSALSIKVDNGLKANPGDQTLGMISRILDKKSEAGQLFIKRSDLRDLYKKFYTRNSKFEALCSDELGQIEELTKPTYAKPVFDGQEITPYDGADQVLANALESVFDKRIPVKMYSKDLAKQAISSIKDSLNSWNLSPKTMEIEAGNDSFFIVNASFDTPKGLTSIHCPLEVVNNKIAATNLFLANSGAKELNYSNIKEYLTIHAGVNLIVGAQEIVDRFTKVSKNNETISDSEMALMRLNASRQEQNQYMSLGLFGKFAEQMKADVPALKLKDEFNFERDFTSATGAANFNFGADKVASARDTVSRMLAGFGYKNAQLKLAKTTDSEIFYAVSIGGKIGFTVPVKISKTSVIMPKVLLCNGSISGFDKESVDSLYFNETSDYKAAAVASPQFELTVSQLIGNIKLAAQSGNNSAAEDALNVLKNSGDKKAYSIGFNIFLESLAGKTQNEIKTSECSMILKNSKVSKYHICGHTGLPVHKVYQDDHGNCRPLYRQGMDETYESANFNTSKMFG